MGDSEIEILCGKQELKQEVETNLSCKPNELYKKSQLNLQSSISDDIISKYLTSYKDIKSTLAKWRAKHLPKIPKEFDKLAIEGKYSMTSNNKIFLGYDNKSVDRRVIIFFSNKAFRILKESKDWFCDGTFKSSPKQLMQIYTVHGLFKDNLFPCLFALTSKKDETTYKLIFKVLKNAAADQDILLNPSSVKTDYEKASINSIRYHFPCVD